jgi:hypothetical protein
MNNAIRLVNEAYNEMMSELHADLELSPEPSRSDISLGNISAQLAQAKGELSTLLDRATRQGIITKKNGKISIIDKDAWIKAVGDLPRKIKDLQNQLTPDPNIHADETDFK